MLDTKVIAKYKTLTEPEIKILVVDDKWMASIGQAVKGEMDRISQRLASGLRNLQNATKRHCQHLSTKPERSLIR